MSQVVVSYEVKAGDYRHNLCFEVVSFDPTAHLIELSQVELFSLSRPGETGLTLLAQAGPQAQALAEEIIRWLTKKPLMGVLEVWLYRDKLVFWLFGATLDKEKRGKIEEFVFPLLRRLSNG